MPELRISYRDERAPRPLPINGPICLKESPYVHLPWDVVGFPMSTANGIG